MARRLTLLLLTVYAVALIASHGWQALGPAPPEAPRPGDVHLLTVRQVRAGERGDGDTTLAYRTWGDPSSPAVLAIHGSPGDGSDFDSLGPLLADRFFVLAPDLPGFGHSDLRLPDVSIRAHADHLLQLLDALGIGRAHVIGYSLGGGPALLLWEAAPERVASLTLLSSIGVQEMEWLGDYHLNHGLHLAQLGLFRLLRDGLPHFGATDAFDRAVLYARNFAESDQRPLRGLLQRLDVPTMVIHGEDDFLVPVEAAREHLRLVPQAREWIAAGGDAGGFGADDHFMVFRERPPFSDDLRAFLLDAEAGRAATRAQADEDRAAAAAAPFDPLSAPPAEGPFLVILVVLIALATFVSEDLACVGAGLLAAKGRITFLAATTGSFVGIFVGDMLLFAVGRLLGRPAVRHVPLRWMVDEAALDRGAAWFARKGPAAIFVSRFLPGLRLPTYLAAGLLGTGVLRFAGWFILAGLAWTPVLVGVSMVAGAQVLHATDWVSRHPLLSLLMVVSLLMLLTRIVPRLFTHRGRRQLVGRWLRLTRWEFWPPWVVYPPVVVWIGLLALRHRSLAVVTAADPAIPGGGILGESKWQILEPLLGSEHLPATAFLPREWSREQRRERVDRFLAEHALPFPVVLKPDAGQRGSGVGVCDSPRDVDAWLEHHDEDALVQAYVGGAEFGVFYVRPPGEPRGRLVSITEKRMPEVVGDGRRTLEQLILDDPRAVAMAGAYAEALGPRLDHVPAEGEAVALTRLGTHCLGAVFLDGERLATPALLDAVERIAALRPGVDFGRFDLRAPSAGHLARGEGLRVIELNGLTSEPTHIYDPRHSVFHGWRVLCSQWSLAFAIGAANARRGAAVTPVRVAVAMAWRHLRGRRATISRDDRPPSTTA